jgi:hypothetical protein
MMMIELNGLYMTHRIDHFTTNSCTDNYEIFRINVVPS